MNAKEKFESIDRLKRFAEIYQAKMDAKPYMEIRARYESMTEAKLVSGEREFAENIVDVGKIDQLLNPEKYRPIALKPA
jgi:hypothetical protein